MPEKPNPPPRPPDPVYPGEWGNTLGTGVHMGPPVREVEAEEEELLNSLVDCWTLNHRDVERWAFNAEIPVRIREALRAYMATRGIELQPPKPTEPIINPGLGDILVTDAALCSAGETL